MTVVIVRRYSSSFGATSEDSSTGQRPSVHSGYSRRTMSRTRCSWTGFMNDQLRHTAIARTPWRTRWSTASSTSSSWSGRTMLPSLSIRSRTPTRRDRGTRSGGRWARVRSSCTSNGIPSAHDRERATWIVSSWPAVAMRPTRGPTRSIRALVPTVVE